MKMDTKIEKRQTLAVGWKISLLYYGSGGFKQESDSFFCNYSLPVTGSAGNWTSSHVEHEIKHDRTIAF